MEAAEKKKILVVDDQSSILQTLEKVLIDWGYDPLLAPDGEDALQVFAENPGILLLITDLNLGGMNGLDLMGILKRQAPLLEGILMTARVVGIEEVIRQGHEAGFSQVLSKPFNLDTLKAMIVDLIGKE